MAAELIIAQCGKEGIPAKTFYIEENRHIKLTPQDVIFFLTNDSFVEVLAKRFLTDGIQVVNGGYLTGDRRKSFAQKLAAHAGVRVPKYRNIISLSRRQELMDGLQFPVYLKCELHGHSIFKIKSLKQFINVVDSLDASLGWYVEEAVDGRGRFMEKYYFVHEGVFSRDERMTPRTDIVHALVTISSALGLEIFSADLAVEQFGHWCVDINCAPALFGSIKARESFVLYIKGLLHSSSKDVDRPLDFWKNVMVVDPKIFVS